MGKKGFTLAETLISLMVIGVVAALTIPALMQQIGDYTLQKQKDVFSKKWAEGLRQMRVDGKLETKYSSTAEFVNEMQKYFKIQAVCDKDNLTGCFTEKITSYENGEAEEFDVKDLKSAKNFNKSEEDSPVYGIRFSDGTSMLLAYKKDCKGITEGDTQGNHTQCLLYVYDVNANKSPNSYGGNTGSGSKKTESEIATMNKGRDMVGNASITKGNAYGLDFEIIGNTAYLGNSCNGDICYEAVNGDYLPGAVNFCERLGGNLPTGEQLRDIALKLYPCAAAEIERGGDWNCEPDKNSNPALWSFVENRCFFKSDASPGDEGKCFNENGFLDVWVSLNTTYSGIAAVCVK